MKRFRFENIWILSHQEKKARHVEFHPKRNLIRGRNHTGKTSLIRALFETLWAKPQGKLEKWDSNTATLLQFSVDDKKFFALRQSTRHALFNQECELLISTSDFGEWCRAFRDCTNFNLVFSDKSESQIVPADPACFFLPFYVNQDGSWQAEWNTFGGLKRFNRPWAAILEYFTGVCPQEYYQAKAEKAQESKVLEDYKRELKLLMRMMNRFDQIVSLTGPKVNPENFAAEIQRLTFEVNELNNRQEILRSVAVHEQELLASLDQQAHLADVALRSYNEDADFLGTRDAVLLVCPTCHAEHQRPFLDLLEFAEDARVLRELAARLREDSVEVQRRHQSVLSELKSLSENYARISRLLDTRKGEMRLREVLNSLGAEYAFAAFETERMTLDEAINQANSAVNRLGECMKELRSKQRAKAILSTFRNAYEQGRVALKLPPVETSKMALTSRPNLSGSGGPRSILAYYAALWLTAQSAGSFDIPVLIDSPNQQAQDDINLPTVLHFIAQELPDDMQLIVGLEDTANFPFDMELHLDAPYQLLEAAQWDSVVQVMEPLLSEMYADVLKDRKSLY